MASNVVGEKHFSSPSSPGTFFIINSESCECRNLESKQAWPKCNIFRARCEDKYSGINNEKEMKTYE